MHDVTFVAAARGQIRGQACGKIANCQAFRCQRLDTARRIRLTRITCIRVSLVALASLGDRVGFGLGVPAGVGVRLLHLPVYEVFDADFRVVQYSWWYHDSLLCWRWVDHCLFFFRGLRHLLRLGFLPEHLSVLLISNIPTGSSVSQNVQSCAVVHRSEPVPVCQSVVFQVHPSACSSLVSVQPFCQSLFSALRGFLLPLPFALLAFSFSIFLFSCPFGQRIDVHGIIFLCAFLAFAVITLLRYPHVLRVPVPS